MSLGSIARVNGLDVTVFRAINGWPDAWSPFFVFLSNATKTTAGLVLLAFIVIGSLTYAKTRKPTVLALVSWPVANATTDVFKHVGRWHRPSWPEILANHPEFHVRVEPLTSFGTASAHSANMMAIAVCFLWLHRPLGWAWLAVAVLTGISRIYVGVHWPSQVLLGWLCGAFVATVVVKSWEAWVSSRPRTREEHPVE